MKAMYRSVSGLIDRQGEDHDLLYRSIDNFLRFTPREELNSHYLVWFLKLLQVSQRLVLFIQLQKILQGLQVAIATPKDFTPNTFVSIGQLEFLGPVSLNELRRVLVHPNTGDRVWLGVRSLV